MAQNFSYVRLLRIFFTRILLSCIVGENRETGHFGDAENDEDDENMQENEKVSNVHYGEPNVGTMQSPE